MLPLRDRLPTRIIPFVTYGLIALNVVSFLWELLSIRLGYARFVFDWGFVPGRFVGDPAGDTITLFTSMFLHGGWMHIGGNMLFLWIFGDNVEDALGHFRYLAFYLAGGILAALAQLAVGPASLVPMVGASGAIAAVLGAYVTLYPRSRITVLGPLFLFELPAWFVILEWFALQLLSGLGALALPSSGGGVAFFAHIGGFVAGLLMIRLLVRGRSGGVEPTWNTWRGPRQHEVYVWADRASRRDRDAWWRR